MDDLFTKTKVNLTQEYIKLYSTYQLASKLSKVKELTGVKTSRSKANNKYTLLGSWEQVNNAFELLQKWHDIPSEEPVEEGKIVEIREHATLSKYQNEAVNTETYNGHNLVLQNESRKIYDVNDISSDKDDLPENTSSCEITDKANKRSATSSFENIKRVETFDTTEEDEASIIVSTLSESKHCVKVKSKAKNALTEVKGPQILTGKNNHLTVVIDDSLSETEHNGSSQGITPTETQSFNESVIYDDTNNDSSKENENKGQIEADKCCKKENNTREETKPGKRNKRKPGDKGYWSRVKIDNYNEKHKCPMCEKVLKSRKRYMEHLRRIHIREFKCNICERRFGYPTYLHRHKCPGSLDANNAKKRNGGRPKKLKVPVFIHCPECDYIGTTKKRFNCHVRKTHRLQFSCDQCEKRFGFASDLQRHKDNVHTEMSHSCEKCSKSYKSKTVFEEHMKTHEEGYIRPKFQCQVCEKSFTTKYALTSHIKTEHLGVKRTYLCQICGKNFSQRNSYKQHSNAHAGIKPYKCDICSAAFTYHKSLREHKFMHDTVRRFQCELCDKAFRQKTTLKIHMKIHKAIKDHICKTCGKGFAQKQALERHERIHTGIKPYTCIPCQKAFGDASTIRRHMLTIHQKDELNWKEDIICTVKKKTDYYVMGSSGQNRTYKRNAKTEIDKSQKARNESAKTKQSELQTNEQQLFLVNTQDQCSEYSLSDLASLHDQTGQFQTLQPGAIFAVSASLAQSLQNINAPVTLNYNNSNNTENNTLPTPILDYSTCTLSQTLQSQLGEKKQENLGNQYELQASCNPLQQNTFAQTSDSLHQQMTEAQISAQDNTSSAVGQNLSNLWGLIGYQSFYNSATATGQYQAAQNQQ